MAIINKEAFNDIIKELDKVTFKLTDESIGIRASSLGYKVVKLGDDITAIELPTGTIVCSKSVIELPKDAHNFFSNFRYLKELDLRYFDTTNVINMCNMFENCSSLKSIDLSNFRTEQVTDMSGMFGSCISLKDIELRGIKTSQVVDMTEMFYLCNNLERLDLSSFTSEKVEDMTSMFYGCSNLVELDISNFKSINADLSGMFTDCINLRKVYINNRAKKEILNELNDTIYTDYLCNEGRLFSIDKVEDIGDNKSVITLISLYEEESDDI